MRIICCYGCICSTPPFEQEDVRRRALRLDVTWAVGIQGWDDRAS